MNYIIIYFLLNSTPYQLPLLPNMAKEEAIKLELIPKDAKEISKDEFDKVINISLDKEKDKKTKAK